MTAIMKADDFGWKSFPYIQPLTARKAIKNKVLIGVNAVLFCIIISFWNSRGAIITTIFKVAGYTYVPILEMYLTGLFSNIQIREK